MNEVVYYKILFNSALIFPSVQADCNLVTTNGLTHSAMGALSALLKEMSI
jgi:hypothetical protein